MKKRFYYYTIQNKERVEKVLSKHKYVGKVSVASAILYDAFSDVIYLEDSTFIPHTDERFFNLEDLMAAIKISRIKLKLSL